MSTCRVCVEEEIFQRALQEAITLQREFPILYYRPLSRLSALLDVGIENIRYTVTRCWVGDKL